MNEFVLVYSKTTDPDLQVLSHNKQYSSDKVILLSNHTISLEDQLVVAMSSELGDQEINFQDANSLIGLECSLVAVSKANDQVIFLRDFPGTEPLYMYQDQNMIIISNTFNGILQVPNVNSEIDYEKVIEYLLNDFVSNDLTLYKNIKKIRPGSINKISNASVEEIALFDPEYLISLASAEFSNLLHKSVVKRQTDNVAYELSGGLDSASVIASIYQAERADDIKSYSVTYSGLSCDEVSSISQFLKVFPHNNIQYSYQALDLDRLKKIVTDIKYFPDFPNSLSALAYLEDAQTNKVDRIITGFGGDHLFNHWKYSTYSSSLKSYLMNDLKLRKFLRKSNFNILTSDAECLFLSNQRKSYHQEISIFENHQNGIMQQLTSPGSSEFIESAALVAGMYGLQKSHPFFDATLISYSLNLKSDQLKDKQVQRNYLKPYSLSPVKGDYTVLWSKWFESNPDAYGIIQDGLEYFDGLLSQDTLKSLQKSELSKPPDWFFTWNLLGIILFIDWQKSNTI